MANCWFSSYHLIFLNKNSLFTEKQHLLDNLCLPCSPAVVLLLSIVFCFVHSAFVIFKNAGRQILVSSFSQTTSFGFIIAMFSM